MEKKERPKGGLTVKSGSKDRGTTMEDRGGGSKINGGKNGGNGGKGGGGINNIEYIE